FEAIADSVIAGERAALAPKDGTVVYAKSHSVEGTGIGRSLVIEPAKGKREEIELCTENDECDKATAEKRAGVIARLKDHTWLALDGHAWPQDAKSFEV